MHPSNFGVGFVQDDAEQSDMSVIYDDMNCVKANGRIIGDSAGHGSNATARAHCTGNGALVGVVLAQGGLGIDSVVYGGAYAVIVGRERENLACSQSRMAVTS